MWRRGSEKQFFSNLLSLRRLLLHFTEETMLKKSITTYPLQWLIGTVCLITAAALLFRADISLANLAIVQEPKFDANSPAAAEMASQELAFGPEALAESGQLDGLNAGPGGLVLAAGYTQGSYTSDVINSPLPFTTDVVPLWAGTGAMLETRLSLDGGQSWSNWLENPAAFYPVRDGLTSGNLVWAGGNQAAVQFRVTLSGPTGNFSRLLLVFNDTSQGPTDADIAGQMTRVAAAEEANICPVEKPEVVAREQWGYPGKWRFDNPPHARYAQVTHVIVHQTETPNNTAPYQDYAGWVRSIWTFHANVLGWGDVGYNYLVDPNGIIYEGRAGGDNVVGIHDTHNAGPTECAGAAQSGSVGVRVHSEYCCVNTGCPCAAPGGCDKRNARNAIVKLVASINAPIIR
jgi:hypothetical protein